MTITVDNLYVIKNSNGTVDTMSGPCESVFELSDAIGFIHGENAEMVQISRLADIDLCAEELKFDFIQSMN